MGPEDTLHSEWSYVSTPLLGWEVKGLIQATLSFPNSLSSLEGPRASLSLGYEFILLLLHSMGMLYTQYWLCSGDNQFSSLATQL